MVFRGTMAQFRTYLENYRRPAIIFADGESNGTAEKAMVVESPTQAWRIADPPSVVDFLAEFPRALQVGDIVEFGI